MKLLKNITSFLILPIILMSFSRCSSQKNLQEKAPVNFGNVYFQKWVAGIQGGGSGINLFIPMDNQMPTGAQLDSVFFRGKSIQLKKIGEDPILYAGYFRTALNQRKDLVMSSDSKQEYGNEAPEINAKIPFELKENECVVSYIEEGKTKYFKIENIAEKQQEHYPSARPNRQ